MSRKYQNRSNFYTYQNRMYNNDINLKDINTQKNLVNDYEEKNHYNNFRQNYDNLFSNFGENNWSRENHGRDLGEKYNTNRIIKNQTNYKQNNYPNDNQPYRNNISPNYNKYSNDKILNYNLSKENHGRDLEKNSDVKPEMKKYFSTIEIGFNNLPDVSIKNNNDNLQQKNIDIIKENKNLEENMKEILNKSPEISIFEKEVSTL